ncbi:hypothetical protein [uncultured Psychrobacter sp.]
MIGFGATCVYPYLAYDMISDLVCYQCSENTA